MEKDEIMQMRGTFNYFRGTMNRPQSYGSDMYNEEIDMAPSNPGALTEAGTDEAGNPIMTSPVAQAQMGAAEAKQEQHGPLSKAVDVLNRVGESMFLDENGKTKSAFDIPLPEAPEGMQPLIDAAKGLYDFGNASDEERKTMTLPYRFKEFAKEQVAKRPDAVEWQHSALFEDYILNATPAEKNAEKMRIAKVLGIDDSILNNRDLYVKAAMAADRMERMGKLREFQTPDGDIDMAKVYDAFPGLAEVQKSQGTAAAALALSNIDGLKTVNDVYEGSFMRFFGSVTTGARRGKLAYERSAIWNDARKENRLLTAEEKKKLNEIDAEMKTLPRYDYGSIAGGVGGMIGSAAENLPMILTSQGAGLAARAAVTRLSRNKKWGEYASNAVGTYMMAQQIAGGQYEELVNKLDKNGKPMYTPEQASWLALGQGYTEAALEQWSLNEIGAAVLGKSATKSVFDIVKKSPTLEAAKTGVKEYVTAAAKEFIGVYGKSFKVETVEEFTQSFGDIVLENMAQVLLKGKDAEITSIEDALTTSALDAIQALPAIAGFSIMGGVAHPIANTKTVLGFRSHVQNITTNKAAQDRLANAHYTDTLSGVWENKGSIKELQDKAPEVVTTILDEQNKRAGMEYGFVDVKNLSQQEGGQALVEEIAQRNNYSADELAACIDGSGMLQVKTSTLMQMDIKDEQHQAIKQNVTASLDAVTETQYNAALDQARQSMKDIVDFKDKTYKKSIDSILAARFPDSDQAALAREIIEANFDNPQEEYSRRLNAVNAEINEEVAPIVAELKKQKVKPKEGQTLTDLAIDIASGKETGYVIPDYQTDEMTAEKVGSLAEQRKELLGIRDRMRELNASEMVATATLDSSALKVYDTLISQLGKSKNKQVQKAAKLNALMFARFAQNMAKVISRVKQKPYTAEDFLSERLKVDVNAVYNQELADAAQLFQHDDNRKILATLRSNVKGWVKVESEKEGLELLEKAGNPKEKLENSELKDGAHLSKGQIENIISEIKKKKRYWIPGCTITDYYEIIINTKLLLPQATLKETKKPGPDNPSTNNEKVFVLNDTEITIQIYTRESKNQRKNKDAVGDTVYKIEISNKKSTPQVAGVAEKLDLRQRWNALSDNIISENDNTGKINLEENENKSLEDIRKSYISKFILGPIDALSNVGEASFKRYDLIDEFCNILEEIGAKRKGQISTYYSSYFILEGNLIRIADHESKQPKEKHDWVVEFVLNDDTIIPLLGNIKSRDELKQFIKTSVSQQIEREKQHETLNQATFRGVTAKGSIGDTIDGQRLIQLFETADQSTFMHEMAHMFLLELQDIAALDPESREAKDLATIVKWAEYKPGQSEEYKGTASEAEFRQREKAIKAAEKAGDTAEAERLKNVWLQERFARGFEEYLRSGEAPATGLQKAFRQFKKWLQEIYTNVTGAGVSATPEVEAIMARIIASEEEIDALDAANSIARKVVDAVPENAAQVLQDMREEAKERAKEKLLRELMQAFEKNNLQGLKMKLDEIRETIQKELQNVPCFVCEGMISNGTPVESAIQFTGFATEQEYRDALKAAGGSLKNAVNNAVKAARENLLKEMPQGQQLYDMAEEAFNSGDYNARLSELEAETFNSMRDEYNSLPAKLRRVFTAIDKGFDAELSKETWETFKKSIRNLKYAERWSAQEYVLIKEFEDAAGKLEEPDREAVEKLRKKYEEIKEQTIRNKEWINGIADATKGRMQAIKTAAEIRLGEEPITVSTNPRYWHRQAIAAAKRAWDGLKKVKTGEKVDYNNAVMAKQEQALYDAMTAQAIKNKQKLDKMLNGKFGFLARGKRMADPKMKADPTLRYYHNHMLYVFGLRQSDAVPPAELKDITKVLAELRASHQFEDEVPAWLITAAAAKEQGKYYQQLTMGELEEMKKFADILYTLARNQNSLLTMDVDMETVQADCTVDYLNNVDYQVGQQRINEITGAIGSYMNSLLKSERFLALLGGEHGAHIRYIYRTLFTASENEEKMQEQEAETLRELYGKYYTRQELRAILNDSIPGLSIGADTNITKENLICMALNMGNETNRARLAMGLFNCQSEAERLRRESELMQLLQENLTEKDWQFVQAMWNHIDSFANPVSRVLEKCLGVPLKRVKAQAFEVQLPDGKILKMTGGYYPIVKDSSKSTRQSEFEQMEEAKAVGGISVLGAGMGTTKDRADNLMLSQGPLKLTLDVAHRHIDAQIHLITMRMAVRDAYKVLNSQAVRSQIENTFGQDTMKSLNEWVFNCWAPPIRPVNRAEQVAANLRSGSISAIMAYRVSTAVLNLANIVYMTNEIGPVNAINAVCKFYSHPKENREAIMAASVYMRNRAANMDRDLRAQEERILNRHEGLLGKAGNAIDKATGGTSEEIRYLIDKYSNRLIEETDMLFSLPLYHWQFVETYNAELAKGVSEEEARETANYEATRRVTKVFPSSRKVDSSEVQRSRSEFVKLLTPFFSFSNTLMNAVWSKYYEGKYNGRVPLEDASGNIVRNENGDIVYTTAKKNFIRRYGRFVLAALMDYMVGAFFETWLRQLPDVLAGGGGDDDDDRIGIGILSVNKKKFFTNSLDSVTGGFYGINAVIDTERVYSALVEGKGVYGGGRGVGVLSGTAQRGIKAVEDVGKLLHGSEKIDMLDFMRDMVKASNAKTGFSDTLTDALFNTVRFAADEGYSLDNMDDLREYIAKTIFDRKLKKKN